MTVWNKRLAWASALFALIVCILYGVWSPGTYNDDDVSHYLIAHHAWRHPSLFRDMWGRPGFTILYAPAAFFGLGAARVFSALLVMLSSLLVARAARLRGARLWWLAVPFTALQPEFLRQGFSTLTELPGAFFLALALLAFEQRRWTWLGLAAGLMPLARYELLPLAALFGFVLARERSGRGLLLLVLPMAAQNILNAVSERSPGLLLFPFDYALGVHPGQGAFDYADHHPLYYVAHAPEIFGWVAAALAAWGLLRLRPGLLHALVVAGFAVLAIASGPLVPKNAPAYHRYAAPLAPLLGFIAAIGFDRLWPARWAERLARAFPRTRVPALHLIGLAAALAAAALTLPGIKPFRLSRERMTVIDTARWFRSGPYADRKVLSSHVWFPYAAQIDRYDGRAYGYTTPKDIVEAPPGSLVIWDSHYSPRLHFGTPLGLLKDQPGFRLLHHRAPHKDFEVYVFEKL